MTGSPNVVLERDGTIQIIRLARPEKKNAITAAMYGALASAIAATNHDPAVRVVMIEGAEGVFCAGNDLDDFLRHPPAGPESEVFRFLNAISTADKPLVAAVAGPAVGIGTTMLLHCDLVYAAENAKFAMPFVNLGICPEAASSYLLPLVAGYQRAAELLMLGEPFGAEAALAAGIVNKVVPTEQVRETALLAARKLAERPASALRVTKRLMRGWHRERVAHAIREEGTAFVSMLDSPEAKEAFNAFFEKRKPDFGKFA